MSRYLLQSLVPSPDATATRVEVHAIQDDFSDWQRYLNTHLALSVQYVVDPELSSTVVAMETQQQEEAALADARDEEPEGPIQLYVIEPAHGVLNYHRVVEAVNNDPFHTVVVLLGAPEGVALTEVETAQYSNILNTFENCRARVFHTIEDAVSYLNGLLY